MTQTAKANIERHAEQLLRLAEISEPPIPVERIAKLRGAIVRYVPFDGELSGMLYKNNQQVIIGVNANHHKTRQRFTIAHELGHLELQHQEKIHIDRSIPIILLRDERSSQAIDQAEIDANAFAAALLMPVYMIRKSLAGGSLDLEDDAKLRKLADQYKVSLQAIVYRLTNVVRVL